MNALVRPVPRLEGRLSVPGDKSVSHRAALLGAVATGVTEVHGLLEGEDCLRTLRAVAGLGAEVTRKGPGHYMIQGVGLDRLTEPDDVIDCGNSGTTARLLLGILAGQPFTTFLTGDGSLRRRPMDRVVEPLTRMGARVLGRKGAGCLPLGVLGARPLQPIAHVSQVASAQVKSAVLLAGLWASGPVSVTEPVASRDHTERMLRAFGAEVETRRTTATLVPGRPLRGRLCRVPGDASSAAFFLVAGALAAAGRVTVEGVGVNPTRTGLLDALEAMGATLDVRRGDDDGEPVAEVTVSPSRLRGTTIAGALLPRAIDEIPVLAVAAACAEGPTEVRDAAELRVKESDRIHGLAVELGKMGVAVEERRDGFRIAGRPAGGRPALHGARVSSWGDHRLAMALIVAGLLADGPTVVEGIDCIATSYPDFVATCRSLGGEACVEVVA
ncbi:MAG: 3-phosphoshikimate 1-carboxyvinyltransferase [Candidatus Rokuibacteriota bacterium]|nr:MAG: 3-phosphoshikimate 1-carboxyvinyltransferase [Candidatus Rokubacteria bacterium]